MACDATSLHVVNLHRGFSSYQRTLNIEEVDVVGCHMDNGPEEHGVCDLAMEPLAFVQRQPSDLWSYIPKQVSAHREKDDHRVHAQTETSTAGKPDTEFEGVERRQSLISRLLVPSEDEQEYVQAMEQGVEDDFTKGELFG